MTTEEASHAHFAANTQNSEQIIFSAVRSV
jgi:hypothetical protein